MYSTLAARLSRFPGVDFPLWCPLNRWCVKSWLWIWFCFEVVFHGLLWGLRITQSRITGILPRAFSLHYFCEYPFLTFVESGLWHQLHNHHCLKYHQRQPYIHFPEAKRSFLPTLTFTVFDKNVERDIIYPYSLVEKTDIWVPIESVSLVSMPLAVTLVFCLRQVRLSTQTF